VERRALVVQVVAVIAELHQVPPGYRELQTWVAVAVLVAMSKLVLVVQAAPVS